MTLSPDLLASETISFAEAMTLSQNFLSQIEQGILSETDQEKVIISLVKSLDGARGFFVTYLTDQRPFIDSPSPFVFPALESSPEIVSELLVKNLVMSTAMFIHHQREQKPDLAQSSARVTARSSYLLQHLNIPLIPIKLQQMFESLTTGEGIYQVFLQRWGYDFQQKQAMINIIQEIHSFCL